MIKGHFDHGRHYTSIEKGLAGHYENFLLKK